MIRLAGSRGVAAEASGSNELVREPEQKCWHGSYPIILDYSSLFVGVLHPNNTDLCCFLNHTSSIYLWWMHNTKWWNLCCFFSDVSLSWVLPILALFNYICYLLDHCMYIFINFNLSAYNTNQQGHSQEKKVWTPTFLFFPPWCWEVADQSFVTQTNINSKRHCYLILITNATLESCSKTARCNRFVGTCKIMHTQTPQL